jgi:type IV secretion system protein VirD4
MRRSSLTDKEREDKRKKNLTTNIIVCTAICLYIGLLVGAVAYRYPEATVIDIIEIAVNDLPGSFYRIFPFNYIYPAVMLFVAMVFDVYLWESSLQKKGIVENPNGDAAFEEDFTQYDREFVIDPTVVQKATGSKPKTYYTEEHKKVVLQPRISNAKDRNHHYKDNIYAACWAQTQIYADGVALSLNGSWCQRNSNAVIFGASGSGKSRYFLNPNLLQANSCYIVTDPSGEIMAGYGGFLKSQGYIVKCLNISEMNKSCRFNPLYYIRDPSDIPIIVTTLMENTQKSKNSGGGDGDFWTKTTQALLCAIIGYLYEVEPLERRNFYNVLELLRMAQEDEDDTSGEDTEFDKMFKKLGEANPNSYAFHQYQTYSLAPRKTALNILISTAVLISTYVDIPEFNNLTFKDEMELDKFGSAPFIDVNGNVMDVENLDESRVKKDKMGRFVEGEPYKMAIFLCIPTADTTYNWLTAMLYSIAFKLVYRRGETRAKQQCTSTPALAMPARMLIDECANIGKIPNLQEYLATCRKYRLSIVPIFQSFSQIVKVYGKEDSNSIISNCDTTLFLGGVDSDTLKIVCDRLGKESVKAMTSGTSKGGKQKSSSQNIQNVGRELMSRIQVEQMANNECLVFIRALKPFRVKKFALQDHPNYAFTAECDPEHYSFINPFQSEYDESEIERVRVKKSGEVGYTEPKAIRSARAMSIEREEMQKIRVLAQQMENSIPLYLAIEEDGKPLERGKTCFSLDKKEQDKSRAAFEADVETVWKGAVKYRDYSSQRKLANVIVQCHLNIDTGDFELPTNCPETKTAEEHQEDIARAANRPVIRDGNDVPSTDFNDYSLLNPYSCLAQYGKVDKEVMMHQIGNFFTWDEDEEESKETSEIQEEVMQESSSTPVDVKAAPGETELSLDEADVNSVVLAIEDGEDDDFGGFSDFN